MIEIFFSLIKWSIKMAHQHLVYQFFILYYLFHAHMFVGFDLSIEHSGDIEIFHRSRLREAKTYILERIEQWILCCFFSCSSFKFVSLFLWYWVGKIQVFGNEKFPNECSD
jgi:hypothetical protein